MVENFSDGQIAAFRDVFDDIDTNHNGTISRTELAKAMRCAGENPTRQEVQDMIDDADDDGSGSLDFPEFLNVMAKCCKDPEDEDRELQEAFAYFDRDGNGSITSEELRQVVLEQGDRMSEEEADEFIAEADINGDGVIKYNEFVKFLRSNCGQAMQECC